MADNFPIGADTPDAPWNIVEPEPQEIEVLVSVTISKRVKIDVDDYQKEEYKDENNNPCVDYDFSECDLRSAVRQQIHLPEDSKEFKDWIVDDFEVMIDN